MYRHEMSWLQTQLINTDSVRLEVFLNQSYIRALLLCLSYIIYYPVKYIMHFYILHYDMLINLCFFSPSHLA